LADQRLYVLARVVLQLELKDGRQRWLSNVVCSAGQMLQPKNEHVGEAKGRACAVEQGRAGGLHTGLCKQLL